MWKSRETSRTMKWAQLGEVFLRKSVSSLLESADAGPQSGEKKKT